MEVRSVISTGLPNLRLDYGTTPVAITGKLPFSIPNTTVLGLGKFVLDSTNLSVGSVISYGAGSAYFNGSASIETPSNSNLNLSGVFTIEGWYRADTVPSYHTVFEIGTYQDGILYRPGDSGNGGMWIQGSQVVNGGTITQAVNTWYHFAIVRDSSNNIALFVNGSRIWSASNYTSNVNSGGSPIKVGASRHTSGQFFTGYIGSIHVLKGTNLYNPTSTTITKPTTGPVVNQTYTSVLLCNNTSSNVDSGPNNVTLTIVGSPVPSNLDANNVDDRVVGFLTAYTETVQHQANPTRSNINLNYDLRTVGSYRSPMYDPIGYLRQTVISNSGSVPFNIQELKKSDGTTKEYTVARTISSNSANVAGNANAASGTTLTQYWY